MLAVERFLHHCQIAVKNAENFVKFMLTEFNYHNKTVMVTPAEDFYMIKGLGGDEIRIVYVLSVLELEIAMDVLKRRLAVYMARNVQVHKHH